jgi:hypothetical protein
VARACWGLACWGLGALPRPRLSRSTRRSQPPSPRPAPALRASHLLFCSLLFDFCSLLCCHLLLRAAAMRQRPLSLRPSTVPGRPSRHVRRQSTRQHSTPKPRARPTHVAIPRSLLAASFPNCSDAVFLNALYSFFLALPFAFVTTRSLLTATLPAASMLCHAHQPTLTREHGAAGALPFKRPPSCTPGNGRFFLTSFLILLPCRRMGPLAPALTGEQLASCVASFNR